MYEIACEIILIFFYLLQGLWLNLWPIWLADLALSCNDFLSKMQSFHHSSLFDCSKHRLEVIFKTILLLINIINGPPSHLAKSLL